MSYLSCQFSRYWKSLQARRTLVRNLIRTRIILQIECNILKLLVNKVNGRRDFQTIWRLHIMKLWTTLICRRLSDDPSARKLNAAITLENKYILSIWKVKSPCVYIIVIYNCRNQIYVGKPFSLKDRFKWE